MYDDDLVHTLVEVYHLKNLVPDPYLLLCKLVLLKVWIHFEQIGNLLVLLDIISENSKLVVEKKLQPFLVLI